LDFGLLTFFRITIEDNSSNQNQSKI